MDIIFYAASLRPGGGLTVAKIMIEALAQKSSNKIIVYTGADDASRVLKPFFDTHENVQEKRFFKHVNSEIRYALSKVYFLPKSLLNRDTFLISVNYYIPSFFKQLVYHLNLLSFLREPNDRLPKKIKEFDAKLACKYTNINVFESHYLRDTAERYTGLKIRNPQVLYVGVDPDFYIRSDDSIKPSEPKTNILLVSSMQPHKDNETCIKVLAKLSKERPDVPWVLNVAGGQTIEQWKPLQDFSDSLGVGKRVRFLGPLAKNELSILMNKSLCLMSASKIESFCMVSLEAMASGCPAVITNETSMPESAGDAAIIVNASSTTEFSNAILQLYDDKKIREDYIKKGIARANDFSIKNFEKNLLEVIEI